MRNKLHWILGLIGGFLMLIASVVIPTYQTANSDVIGGAGWPTFWFLFQQTAWLAISGIGVMACSAAALLIRKYLK